MGVYRVDSPAAAQMRAIKRLEEKEKKRKRERGAKERRAADVRGGERLKEASAAAEKAQQAYQLDTLQRQVRERLTPKGSPQWNKFIWHGELPSGSKFKPQPAGDISIKQKKGKTIPIQDAYQIILKGRPIPDMTDPNESLMAGTGLPDVPGSDFGRQVTRQPIPGAGPTHKITAGINPEAIMLAEAQQAGGMGMGGGGPFGVPLDPTDPTQGYDLTAAAQAGYTQPPAGGQPPELQHLFKAISAMGAGTGKGGKSKMADFQELQQALSMMGMDPATRDEMVAGWGFAPKAAGQGLPKNIKIKGETEGGTGARTTPARGRPESRKRLSTMKEVTADPMAMARVKQQLARFGLTIHDIQVDDKGPFIVDPRSNRKMRFTEVQGAK